MPLAWLGLGFALGLFAQAVLGATWQTAALAAVALGAVFLRLRLAGFRIGMAAVFLAGALLGVVRPLPALDAPDGLTPLLGSEATLRAVVSGAPEPAGGSLRLSIETTEALAHGQQELPFATLSADGWAPAPGRAIAWAAPDVPPIEGREYPYLRHGDAVVIRGFVDAPGEIGPFDYREHLAARGVGAVVTRAEVAEIAPGAGGWEAALHQLRSRLRGALQRSAPEPAASLASAMLLGMRAGLPPEVSDDFRRAGLAHILAISGLHVGMALGVALLISQAILGRRYGLYLVLPLAAVWGYVLLAGAPPSAVRAAMMGSAFLLALAVGRTPAAINALGLAAFLLLLAEPRSLWDRSFQLSFSAMAGVLLLGLPASEWARGRVAGLRGGLPHPLVRTLQAVAASLAVSLGAFAGSLPLAAYNFGQVPLFGAPATLLAMAFTPFFLIVAALAAAVGLALPPLAAVFGAGTWLLGGAIAGVASAFAALPGASARVGGSEGLSEAWIWAGYAPLALAVAWRLRGRWAPAVSALGRALRDGAASRAERLVVLGGAGVLAGAVWIAALTPDAGLLELHALDVGQGDALLIVTPDGATALVDGGPDPRMAVNRVDAALPLDGLRIDLGVLTHGHADHAAGFMEMARRGRFGAVVVPPPIPGANEAWRGELDALGVETAEVARGMTIALGADATLRALNPPSPPLSGTASDVNNNAAALRLDYGETSALLMADLFVEAEWAMLDAGVDVSADLLKVGHHGSATSTSPEFLAAVGPSAAVVSVGADNRFGHPSDGVMARLERRVGAAQLFTTAEDGCVRFASDGERWHSSAGCD